VFVPQVKVGDVGNAVTIKIRRGPPRGVGEDVAAPDRQIQLVDDKVEIGIAEGRAFEIDPA
jgi:hypothetical protein